VESIPLVLLASGLSNLHRGYEPNAGIVLDDAVGTNTKDLLTFTDLSRPENEVPMINRLDGKIRVHHQLRHGCPASAHAVQHGRGGADVIGSTSCDHTSPSLSSRLRRPRPTANAVKVPWSPIVALAADVRVVIKLRAAVEGRPVRVRHSTSCSRQRRNSAVPGMTPEPSCFVDSSDVGSCSHDEYHRMSLPHLAGTDREYHIVTGFDGHDANTTPAAASPCPLDRQSVNQRSAHIDVTGSTRTRIILLGPDSPAETNRLERGYEGG